MYSLLQVLFCFCSCFFACFFFLVGGHLVATAVQALSSFEFEFEFKYCMGRQQCAA